MTKEEMLELADALEPIGTPPPLDQCRRAAALLREMAQQEPVGYIEGVAVYMAPAVAGGGIYETTSMQQFAKEWQSKRERGEYVPSDVRTVLSAMGYGYTLRQESPVVNRTNLQSAIDTLTHEQSVLLRIRGKDGLTYATWDTTSGRFRLAEGAEGSIENDDVEGWIPINGGSDGNT